MIRHLFALIFVAVGLALALPAAADARLRFHRCGAERCAALTVPLDRSGAVPGRLSLRVERHNGFGRGPHGLTLVLADRPGMAGSWLDEAQWTVHGRDVILFDQRGTGAGALRCRDLEAANPVDAGREAAACATLLGERRGLFRTSDTVEDIEALRAELGAERLAIVAGGYGAYVAQRYALRYPDHVERLLLEAPVDAAGLDPLYVDSMAAARRVLPALCRRACRSFTRDPVADTARLAEQLVAEPLKGPLVGRSGRARSATLTPEALLYLLVSADDGLVSLPEYPAAVASALRGDPAPILRLARRARVNPLDLHPRFASVATRTATLCEELRLPSGTAMDPALAAPFSPETLAASDLVRRCHLWPRASSGPPPEPGPMPDVPVLVLASPYSVRSALETSRRTAARFPHGQLLELTDRRPQLVVFPDPCALAAAERFLRGKPVRQRCPSAGGAPIPPARPAPLSLRELEPVHGVAGRRGRLLRAVGTTLGDMIDSFYAELFLSLPVDDFEAGFRAGGLRGGRFAITERMFVLDRYEYVPGVRLSTRLSNDGPDVVPLFVDGPGSLDARLRIKDSSDDLSLRVRGRVAGRRVRARVRIESRTVKALAEVEGGGGSARAAALRRLLR